MSGTGIIMILQRTNIDLFSMERFMLSIFIITCLYHRNNKDI